MEGSRPGPRGASCPPPRPGCPCAALRGGLRYAAWSAGKPRRPCSQIGLRPGLGPLRSALARPCARFAGRPSPGCGPPPAAHAAAWVWAPAWALLPLVALPWLGPRGRAAWAPPALRAGCLASPFLRSVLAPAASVPPAGPLALRPSGRFASGLLPPGGLWPLAGPFYARPPGVGLTITGCCAILASNIRLGFRFLCHKDAPSDIRPYVSRAARRDGPPIFLERG